MNSMGNSGFDGGWLRRAKKAARVPGAVLLRGALLRFSEEIKKSPGGAFFVLPEAV
ncbi:MAG: hypothetical protein ACJ8HI_04710 [Massilia sp.]